MIFSFSDIRYMISASQMIGIFHCRCHVFFYHNKYSFHAINLRSSGHTIAVQYPIYRLLRLYICFLHYLLLIAIPTLYKDNTLDS